MATQRSTKHLALTEEGVRALNNLLIGFLLESGAKAVLLMDKSGQLITTQGETSSYDTMSLSALFIGAFNSTKALATLLGESEFRRMFQQGHQYSVYMAALSTQEVLAVIFSNQVAVGRIKYKLEQSLDAIDQQMQTMYQQTALLPPMRPAQPPAPKLNDLF